jgi:hypothetical protein
MKDSDSPLEPRRDADAYLDEHYHDHGHGWHIYDDVTNRRAPQDVHNADRIFRKGLKK